MTWVLWIVQALLALLFLYAGGLKLILPVEEMTAQIPMPGTFLRFIGVCEVLGAIGLIVPGLTRIRPGLTPLAAAGLVIIMIGRHGDHADVHAPELGATPSRDRAPGGVRRLRPLASGSAGGPVHPFRFPRLQPLGGTTCGS